MFGSYSQPTALPGARRGSLGRPLNLDSGDLEVSREEVKEANLQLEVMLAELLEVSGMIVLAN
jgi:hypothetical protein